MGWGMLLTWNVAEQLDSMNASPEDEDPMLKDMLSTLISHL